MPSTNLRDSKREQARAKDTKESSATVTPIEKAAKPKARQTLRWTPDGERDNKNRVAAHAVTSEGDRYEITGAGDQWKAVHTGARGKVTVLAEKVGHTKAYQECVKHHKG